MIISMPNIARSQRRYDHRLRNLVQRTGDMTVATDLGVPRSTARGWLGETPTVVVCMDVTELTEPELRHEVVKLRRRVFPTRPSLSRGSEVAIKLLRFLALFQSLLSAISRFGIHKRNLLEARVIIASYNDHCRLSPETTLPELR